jgi:hypothetical protein
MCTAADESFAATEVMARLNDDEPDVVLAALAAVPKVIGRMDAEALFSSLTTLLRGEGAKKGRSVAVAAMTLLVTDYVTAHPEMAEKAWLFQLGGATAFPKRSCRGAA